MYYKVYVDQIDILHRVKVSVVWCIPNDLTRRNRGQLSLHIYAPCDSWAHQARAYPSFCSMKRLGVIYSSLDVMLRCPSYGYSRQYICQFPFTHLGGERHCESKVSCPRTQIPGSDSKHTNHESTMPFTHFRVWDKLSDKRRSDRYLLTKPNCNNGWKT